MPDLAHSETRSLHYFRCHAVHRITAPFQSKLWMNCIFSLAESHDFVKSALVAFSSTHESYTHSSESRPHLQRVAQCHYNKALKLVSSARESKLSVDAVLVACLIFYSLESMRGDFYHAMQHAHAGIKIIRDRPLHSSSPATDLTEILSRDFLALQNQVQELSDSTTSRAFDSIHGFNPHMSDHFDSIEDALHHIEVLHNEVYCLGYYCEVLRSQGHNLADEFASKLAPRFTKAVTRFNRWSQGVRQLETSTQNNLADMSSPGYLILKIYESIGASMLASFSTCVCYNTFDGGLARGLDLIERFLDLQSSEISDVQHDFSVSLGVIPLLFTLCQRCNSIPLRDRSLQLLQRTKRREGLWDSKTALAMATRVIAIKDRLATTGYHESAATVHVAEISFVSESAIQMTLTCTELEKSLQGASSHVSRNDVQGDGNYVEIIHIDSQ